MDIDVSNQVISLDGTRSHTLEPLVNGDVIVFEYLYEYAGINGQAEVEYLDNRFVIADTANGKFYKYKLLEWCDSKLGSSGGIMK